MAAGAGVAAAGVAAAAAMRRSDGSHQSADATIGEPAQPADAWLIDDVVDVREPLAEPIPSTDDLPHVVVDEGAHRSI